MKNEGLKIKRFDSMLRPDFQQLSETFWTPEEVVKTAIDWLGLNASSKFLDIGSGVGKFCILASHQSDTSFTGVEIRQNLVKEANRITQHLELDNCKFICDDIKNIEFSEYDCFYYYNSFCEHLAIDEVIDDSLELSRENHRRYEDLIFEQLSTLKKGVRMVTYQSSEFVLPSSYRLVRMNEEGTLVLWENGS